MLSTVNRCSASSKSVTKEHAARGHAVVAHFEDKATVDAVTAAPPIVRLFLEEAGFGSTLAQTDEVDAPAALTLLGMRRALSEQLTLALSNRALKKALARAAKESEFDVAAFIASVVSRNPDKQSMEIRVLEDFSVQEAPHFETDEAPTKLSAEMDRGLNDRILPRRPSQLRGKGLKSRLRPFYG